MRLDEELKIWGYHSDISEEGKRQHLEMAEKAEQLQAERDAVVRYVKANRKAVHWFSISPGRKEFKDAEAENDKAWLEITEATRKEIEDE